MAAYNGQLNTNEFYNSLFNQIRLAKVYADSFNSEPWNERWTEKSAAARLRKIAADWDFIGLYAVENGEICGMILGASMPFYTGKPFEVKEFCVNNSMRGCGIGGKLYRKFEEMLKSSGVTDIFLFTIAGDLTERFYNKMGFSTDDFAVLMRKVLE